MRIVHCSKTPCAGAIEALSSAITDYTEHESRAINSGGKVNNLSFPHDVIWSDSEIFPLLARADVIVFHQNMNHSTVPMADILQGDPKKKACVVYHSHPDSCDKAMAQAGFPVFSIAQYQHALWQDLCDRSKVAPLRNVIRFDRADWPQRDEARERRQSKQDKIWIGYSPTFQQTQKGQEVGSSIWHHSKGYDVTMPILEKIDEEHENVEVMLFEGIRYESCIDGKAQCDILIDEVVTGSYHRSTLEGLALGVPTIVNVRPELHGLIVDVAGANDFPIVHATIENLKEQIEWLLGMKEQKRRKMGNDSHDWMARHWHPRDIAREFCLHLEALPTFEEVGVA